MLNNESEKKLRNTFQRHRHEFSSGDSAGDFGLRSFRLPEIQYKKYNTKTFVYGLNFVMETIHKPEECCIAASRWSLYRTHNTYHQKQILLMGL